MTYKSKAQIEKKQKQVNFMRNEIHKFKGRIFVNNGIDPETGAHPLITHLSSFLAHTRSIIQYAYKEAKESGKLNEFEQYIRRIDIFRLFREIRNSDIHEYTIGCHSTINAIAEVDTRSAKDGVVTSKPVRMVIESLDDINKPKKENPDVSVEYSLCKRVKVTDELLMELEAQGKQDLLKAAGEGKELYDSVDFLGNSDLHDLCDIYVEELNRFVEHGVRSGFIS
jgi:hypothetical protein